MLPFWNWRPSWYRGSLIVGASRPRPFVPTGSERVGGRVRELLKFVYFVERFHLENLFPEKVIHKIFLIFSEISYRRIKSSLI